MKLANPACRKKRKCQPFCGMCNTTHRLITQDSLFGECRLVGKCVCLKYSHTQNCMWINGTNGKGQDCTWKEHPQHHTTHVSESEVREYVDEHKLFKQMERKEKFDRYLQETSERKKLKGVSKRIIIGGPQVTWRIK